MVIRFLFSTTISTNNMPNGALCQFGIHWEGAGNKTADFLPTRRFAFFAIKSCRKAHGMDFIVYFCKNKA